MKAKPFRYSTLQDWYKCPTYYKHKHIDGLSDGIEKSADVAFGSCLHLGMQDIFEDGNGVDVFRLYWSMHENKNLEYKRYGHEALDYIGTRLLERFVDEHKHKFKPIHLEEKMVGQMGGHAFSGTTDMIATYKGKLSVVDWKTSAMPYNKYKIRANEQMYGYASLARQKYNLNIEQLVYGVAIKDDKNPRWQFREEPLLPEVLEAKTNNIAQVCTQIASASIYVRNPSACVIGNKVCPFFNKCYGSGGNGGGEEGETS